LASIAIWSGGGVSHGGESFAVALVDDMPVLEMPDAALACACAVVVDAALLSFDA
jgi:hypothetical protein